MGFAALYPSYELSLRALCASQWRPDCDSDSNGQTADV